MYAHDLQRLDALKKYYYYYLSIYLSQHFTINMSQQFLTNLNHIPAPNQFIFVFKFFKNTNSIFKILTAFLSWYLAVFFFPGSIGTCISPLLELVLL